MRRFLGRGASAVAHRAPTRYEWTHDRRSQRAESFRPRFVVRANDASNRSGIIHGSPPPTRSSSASSLLCAALLLWIARAYTHTFTRATRRASPVVRAMPWRRYHFRCSLHVVRSAIEWNIGRSSGSRPISVWSVSRWMYRRHCVVESRDAHATEATKRSPTRVFCIRDSLNGSTSTCTRDIRPPRGSPLIVHPHLAETARRTLTNIVLTGAKPERARAHVFTDAGPMGGARDGNVAVSCIAMARARRLAGRSARDYSSPPTANRIDRQLAGASFDRGVRGNASADAHPIKGG